jgi:hypothetical protein
LVVASQERPGKSPTPPEATQGRGAYLRQVKAAHLDKGDSAGEGLRALAKQFGRSAAQDQEADAKGLAVDKNPENRKQIGLPLDFVDHN